MNMIDSPIKNMLSKLLKGARQIFVFTKNLIPVSGLYQDVLESEHNRGLPEVRDKCYNAIIINTVIIYFMSIQVQLINEYYKVTCYCETCFSAKSLHQLLLLWRKMTHISKITMKQSPNRRSVNQSHADYMT